MTPRPDRIVNYTTTVSVDRTVTEIKAILRANGAQAVTEVYAEGRVAAVECRLPTDYGEQWYRLPARPEQVLKLLVDTRNRGKRPYDPRWIDYPTGPNGGPVRRGYEAPKTMREQAERTAWRTIKDWVEAQMALIRARQASLDEVMLPYALATDAQTVYQVFREGKLLALPSG